MSVKNMVNEAFDEVKNTIDFLHFQINLRDIEIQLLKEQLEEAGLYDCKI
jgi:hypothetical protein